MNLYRVDRHLWFISQETRDLFFHVAQHANTYRDIRPIGTAIDSRVPTTLWVDAKRATLEKGCLGVQERDRSLCVQQKLQKLFGKAKYFPKWIIFLKYICCLLCYLI